MITGIVSPSVPSSCPRYRVTPPRSPINCVNRYRPAINPSGTTNVLVGFCRKNEAAIATVFDFANTSGAALRAGGGNVSDSRRRQSVTSRGISFSRDRVVGHRRFFQPNVKGPGIS